MYVTNSTKERVIPCQVIQKKNKMDFVQIWRDGRPEDSDFKKLFFLKIELWQKL